MKKMACVLALATGSGLALGAAGNPAQAEPMAPMLAARGLQVNIISPGTITGDATTNLNVKFRGGKLSSVELYVDGTLVSKQTVQTIKDHGTIDFAIDSSILSEGSHEVIVKAFDRDGNSATATSLLKVNVGDLNAPLRYLYPKSNAMVQGVVPIEVSLNPSINKPYVMFFVDKDFKALVNYPPYTYNWDSSHLTNGIHVLGVKAYDGDTLAEVNAQDIRIIVNNPGGLTTRQSEVADLNKPAKPALKAIPSPKVNAPATHIPFDGSEAGFSLLSLSPKMLQPMLPGVRPHGTYASRGSKPVMDAHVQTGITAPDAGIARTAPPTGLAAVVRSVKPGLRAMLAGPRDMAALNLLSTGSSFTRQSVRPLRAGNIAARPNLQPGNAPASDVNAHSKVVPVKVASAKAQVGSGSLFTTRKGSFDVAFDNSRIAFDVLPRVEHGLPLAPFRQIFEHTGGTLEWFGKAKVVRAVNDKREIEIHVGNREAKVNNQSVTMEATPYIDRGRTIVPLSFIRDALDVEVQFDAKTGHLRIESKK